MVNIQYTYNCWYQGLNLGLQRDNALFVLANYDLALWLKMLTIIHMTITPYLFDKLNVEKKNFIFFSKWNRWKFILEFFSNGYTCLINKNIKFEAIWIYFYILVFNKNSNHIDSKIK
jgi:hypothetical protein